MIEPLVAIGQRWQCTDSIITSGSFLVEVIQVSLDYPTIRYKVIQIICGQPNSGGKPMMVGEHIDYIASIFDSKYWKYLFGQDAPAV